MTTPLLSLDIQDDLVVGVLLHSGHKTISVAGCGGAAIRSRPIEEAIAEVVEQTGFHDGACRISFSAGHFFFRNLSLPFSDTRKINKILPFELEETAPIEIAKLLVDAIPVQQEDGQGGVIAAMVERTFLADRLALLFKLGLDPEIITVSGVQTAVRLMDIPDCPPDLLLLDIGLQRASMIVVKNRRIILIRPLGFDNGESRVDFRFGNDLADILPDRPQNIPEACMELASAVKRTFLAAKISEVGMVVYLTGPIGQQRDLAKHLEDALVLEIKACDLLRQFPFLKIMPGIEARLLPWGMDQALALGIRQVKSRTGFNFRKDAFARKISWKQYRHLAWKIAAATTALVLVAGFFLWFTYLSGKAEEKRLAMQIQGVFSATLPAVTRIVDPVQQLQVEINRLKQASGGGRTNNDTRVLDLLAEISKSIPLSLQVHLTLMAVDEKGVRLKGETDNFNTVDIIKKKLQGTPYFSSVTISSANLAPKGGEIRFELKLQLSGT